MWTPKERIKHPLPQTTWPSTQEANEALLYQPISLNGKLELETRTWVPAMVPWRATEEGLTTEALYQWYERFARGRPGAIVVEATGIRDIPSGPLLRIGHPRFEEGLARLVETVHKASGGHTRLFIQLIDFLRVHRRPKPETYFQRYLVLDETHREKMAELWQEEQWLTASEADSRNALLEAPPSDWETILTPRELEALTRGFRQRVTDLKEPSIRDLPQQLPSLFAEAAARAKKVGFDGVELHYAHAYTMASFLSALNTRGDGYGGSRENRVRLPLEVYQAVRQQVGDDYVVGCRFLGDEIIQGGNKSPESIYFGLQFAAAGFDYLSLSTGGKFEDAKAPKVGHAIYPYTGQSGYECMPTVYSDSRGPFGRNVHLSSALRQALRDAGETVPVVTAGGIQTFEQAEAILQSGKSDIIASARQSIADPDWFEKARLGLGEEIQRCKMTNYCEALDQHHKEVTCQLWDRKNRDAENILLSQDGKRRLTAPDWSPDEQSDP